MKTTLTNRIRLAVVSSMLALAGVVGLAGPAAAAPVAPPCEPVIGEDGEPVVICDPGPLPDVMAPTVMVVNPDDTTVRRNQTVLVTAFAVDNVGVTQVEIYANGVLLSTSMGSAGAASWTPTERGTYTLTAKAYDAAGNVGTTAVGKIVTVK